MWHKLQFQLFMYLVEVQFKTFHIKFIRDDEAMNENVGNEKPYSYASV